MKKLFVGIISFLIFSCSQPINTNSEIYPGITACGDFMFVGQDSTLITYNSYGFESWIREAIENDFKRAGLSRPIVVNDTRDCFIGWTRLPQPTSRKYYAVRIYKRAS